MKKLKPNKGSSNNPLKESILNSNVYEIYEGGFGYNVKFLSTYICSSCVSFLKEDLITFESLLKTPTWPVSKVMQREVDRKRVSEIASGYIKGNDSVKYFPPIVVALIPRNGDQLSEIYEMQKNDSYDKIGFEKLLDKSNLEFDADDKNEFLTNQKNCLSHATGLFIKKPYEGINFAVFSWDKNKYFAIVIDGQHRFEALKLASIEPGSEINNYKQDLIFIDGSKLFFSSKGEIDPIRLFRKLFIVINKHPVEVSPARQIIMDDLDVSKLIVQSLVDDSQSDSFDYILPELIDWNSSANKHELPYLTSIINLYTLINEKLLAKRDLSSLMDFSDETKIEKWVERLNNYLLVDKTIDSKKIKVKKLNDSFEEFKSRKEINEYELFAYDQGILKVAQDNFIELFRKSFVHFFNKIRPYSELINLLKKEDILNPQNDKRAILLKSFENRTDSESLIFRALKLKLEKSEVNKNFFILFSVIGQKALFDLYYTFLMDQRQGQITQKKHLEITDNFLQEYNKMFLILEKLDFKFFGQNNQVEFNRYKNMNYKNLKPYAISTNFWDDLLYYDGNIKYNNIGLKAIKNVLQYIKECIEIPITQIMNFKNLDIPEFKNRIKLKLVNDYKEDDYKANEIAELFVELKSSFVREMIFNYRKK